MTAVLALHLATSGKILQKTFNMVFHRHKISAQLILKTHPFIKSWTDPKDNVLEAIGKLLKQNCHLFQDSSNDLAQAMEDIKGNNPDLEKRVKRRQEEAIDAKRRATIAYAAHIERAIDLMLQNLYTLACQTWLPAQAYKQSSVKAQWEILIKQSNILDEQLSNTECRKQGSPPYCIKHWLPPFEQIFGPKAEESKRTKDIIQGAIQQIQRIFEADNTRHLNRRALRHSQEEATINDANVSAADEDVPGTSATPQHSDTSQNVDDRTASSNSINASLSFKEPAQLSSSLKTTTDVKVADLTTDTLATCVADRPWREPVNVKLLPLLDQATLPADEDFFILDTTAAPELNAE